METDDGFPWPGRLEMWRPVRRVYRLLNGPHFRQPHVSHFDRFFHGLSIFEDKV